MSESVEALAEKVRGCLNDRDGMTFNGARRALDALLARLAEAERERDLLREEIRIREESQIPMIPRAASERLKAAEAERDKWKALYGEIGARMARYGDALERLRLAVNEIVPALDQNEVVNERDRARLLDASYAADAVLNPGQP